MRKNIVEPVRPQTTLWRMRFASWIPKAANIYLEYVILIGFPRCQWLRERTSMLHVTYPLLLTLIRFYIIPVWMKNRAERNMISIFSQRCC
jgi:hypothetical protein